jgi:hypothetical protein
MDDFQKRSSPIAAESRLTWPRQDDQEFRALWRNLEKRPATGPVTKLIDVINPVTLARSFAET